MNTPPTRHRGPNRAIRRPIAGMVAALTRPPRGQHRAPTPAVDPTTAPIPIATQLADLLRPATAR